MKSIVNRIVVVVMVGALASVAAFGKTHKQRVTFDTDMKVNGTLVKKGDYEVKFDDATGQLSINKNGKTVVQTTAKFEARPKKANGFQLRSIGNGEDHELVSLTFGGSNQDVVITSGGATTTGNN
jgi:hypothetical protein